MQIVVPVPPDREQARIVDLVNAIGRQIRALDLEAQLLWRAYSNSSEALFDGVASSGAQTRPLSDVLALHVERVAMEPGVDYRLAGVLNAGKGLMDKGTLSGEQTEYSAMNVLRAGQVVMRKLTAWEGPIAVVPQDFDGFVASNEFPTFTINDQACPEWMSHVCRSERLWYEMRSRVSGSVQRRKRLNPDQLLSVELPIPNVERQRRIAGGLDALLQHHDSVANEAAALRALQRSATVSLLTQSIEMPTSYDRVLEGVRS